jgi:hypothetical protein
MTGAFGQPMGAFGTISANASADFFGGGGISAAKFPVVGTVVSGIITEEPTVQQQKDFTSGEPLVWSDGSPRLQLVVTLRTAHVDPSIPGDNGERRLYVKGAMRTAIAQAVKTSGKRQLDIGATLTVTYAGDGEAARPGLNPPKLYTAVYAPPAGAQGEFLATAPAPAAAPADLQPVLPPPPR